MELVSGGPSLATYLAYGKGRGWILQLQVTRMDFNWRWQNAASQYPNFAAHANRLMHFWTKFSEYLRELRDQPLVVRSVEVIKISQIKEGDSWSQWSDIEKIFPQFRLSALGDEWSLNGFASALDITHADGKVHVELKAGNLLEKPTARYWYWKFVPKRLM